MTLTWLFLLALAVAVAVPVVWGLRHPKRQPTEYELALQRMGEHMRAMHVAIAEQFTPAIQKAGAAMNEFARVFADHPDYRAVLLLGQRQE